MSGNGSCSLLLARSFESDRPFFEIYPVQSRKQKIGFHGGAHVAPDECIIFKILAEKSRDAIYLTDARGVITYLSPVFSEMTGYPIPDVLGRHFDSFLSKADALRTRAAFGRDVKKYIGSKYLELKIRRKDGTWFWGELTGGVVVLNGKVIATHGSIRDITERKRDPESFAESKKDLYRIFDGVKDGILVADAKTKQFLFANDEICRLLGYRRQEMLSLGVKSIHRKEDLSFVTLQFKHLVEGQKTKAFDIPLLRKDGVVLSADVAATNIVYNGRPCIVGVFRDMTLRKQAEEEARSHQIRLDMALDAAGMVTWEWDIPTRTVHYSKQIRDVVRGTAVKPFESLDTLLPRIHPEDRGRLARALDQTMRLGTPFECEYRAHMLDGTYRWILGKGKRMVVKGGKPQRVLGLSMDITEFKKAEEELIFKNALLSSVQDASIEGILAIDPHGKIIFTNCRFAELWRIPSRLVKLGDDKTLLKYVLGQLKDPEGFLGLVNQLYADRKKKSFDQLEFNDGRVFSRYSSPLANPKGDYLGRIWFFRDITHEIEVDRAKSEFIAIASHQLRTPLTATKWLLQAIVRRGHLTAFQAEFIRKAIEANDRMIQLANDLLDISSLESGAIQPLPVKTDLVQFLDRLIEDAHLLSKAKKQTLLFHKPRIGISISIDRKLIAQAISNILANAIQYSDRGKTIHISLSKTKDHHAIHIRDEGVGIPKSDQKRLFEKFFRGDQAKQYSTVGSGLGLNLAQKVLSLSGGSIRLKSQPGKGTTVTILLPRNPIKPSP
jgi:PAS domain S-box-containing protein